MRILVIEDDRQVASFICRGLREQLYTVDHAEDGEQGLFLAQTGEYDLLLLDLGLPSCTGMDVIQSLRAAGSTVPVLMLTGHDQLKDKVSGLDAGADDYLTKPFKFDELLARVRALLRRRGDLATTMLSYEDLQVDVLKRQVTRGGRKIDLTPREYELLETFLRRPNQVLTRDALASRAWRDAESLKSNAIDVYIGRLRRKIDSDFSPKLLHTVRDRGYTLQVAATAPVPAGAPE